MTVSLRDDLDLVLLDVTYSDKSSERYQVLVRWDTGPIEEYADIATIGADEDRTAYDALYNPADAKYFLSLVDSSATVGDVRFGKEPDAALPMDAAPRVSARRAEQHQRRLRGTGRLQGVPPHHAGHQPGHRTEPGAGAGGQPQVARLLGSYETKLDDEPYALGMVTEFAANSAEGWDMATASTRDLFAEGDLYADEVGGDSRGRVLPARRGRTPRCTPPSPRNSARRRPWFPDRRRAGAAGVRGRVGARSRAVRAAHRGALPQADRGDDHGSACTATCTSGRCFARRSGGC